MAVKQEVTVIVIIMNNDIQYSQKPNIYVPMYLCKIFYFIMATPVAAVFRNKQLTEH